MLHSYQLSRFYLSKGITFVSQSIQLKHLGVFTLQLYVFSPIISQTVIPAELQIIEHLLIFADPFVQVKMRAFLPNAALASSVLWNLIPATLALPGWMDSIRRDYAPVAYDPVYGAPPGGYGGYTYGGYGPQPTLSTSSSVTDLLSSPTSEIAPSITETSQTGPIRETSTSSLSFCGFYCCRSSNPEFTDFCI